MYKILVKRLLCVSAAIVLAVSAFGCGPLPEATGFEIGVEVIGPDGREYGLDSIQRIVRSDLEVWSFNGTFSTEPDNFVLHLDDGATMLVTLEALTDASTPFLPAGLDGERIQIVIERVGGGPMRRRTVVELFNEQNVLVYTARTGGHPSSSFIDLELGDTLESEGGLCGQQTRSFALTNGDGATQIAPNERAVLELDGARFDLQHFSTRRASRSPVCRDGAVGTTSTFVAQRL